MDLHEVAAIDDALQRFGDRTVGQRADVDRRAVSDEGDPRITPEYSQRLIAEHEAIVAAIQNGNEGEARDAMRTHLKNSQARYRQFLRDQRR